MLYGLSHTILPRHGDCNRSVLTTRPMSLFHHYYISHFAPSHDTAKVI